MLRLYSASKYGEDCYNILLDKPLEDDKLNNLLNILYKDNCYVPYKKSLYKPNEIVEYGFKLNFESPWSTHMRTILKNSKIDNILRIEKKKEYFQKIGMLREIILIKYYIQNIYRQLALLIQMFVV